MKPSADGLRLLILTADFPPEAWSGIAAAVSTQAQALADSGADVCVLTRSSPASQDSSVCGRLRVRSLSKPRFPFPGMVFDWIHLHSLSLSELAFELRRRYGTRIAYTAHSVISRELEDGPGRRFWSDLQLRVMTECDALILVSESERQAVFSAAPEIARRSHVIANAVPAPPPRLTPYDPAGPVVFAGRFVAQKGLATLRQVLPAIQMRWQGQIVLAGGHGDSEGSAAVRELRMLLGERLSTPGWLGRAQVDALFARASLALVPSRYEPFGMVALEAMRVGAPVLAASVGGLAEIVRTESGGRLVNSEDAEAWRDQILELLQDATAAREMARRGPEYVKSRFHPSVTAARLTDEIYLN